MWLQTLGFSLLLLIFAFETPVWAQNGPQNGPTLLTSGTSVERQIGPGQTQLFQVAADQDQYVQLVVDQHGIDVFITVSSPSGKVLGEFDSPNGKEGPENVSFVASSPGTYLIAVAPLKDQDVKPGKIEIRIIEIRQATDSELEATRNREGLKDKGIALVAEVVQTIDQIRLARTRIRAQLQAADMLWTSDEKLARKLSADAVAGVTDYLANVDASDGDAYGAYMSAMHLRQEVIQALAPHDPEMALNFLRSSRFASPPNGKKQQHLEESQLELALATQVLRNDPKVAFQIAENTLKTSTPPELFQTILQLNSKSPELSTKLTALVLAKVESSKLGTDEQLSQLVSNLISYNRSTRDRQQPNAGGPGRSLLTDEQYRTLIQKSVSDVLASAPNDLSTRNATQSLLYTLKSLGPSIDTIVPGSSASIDRRMARYSAQADPNALAWQKYQTMVNSESTDTAVTGIKDAPPEMRQQLYGQLSIREAQQGNVTRARELIMDNINTPFERRRWLQNLEQQLAYKAASEGRIEDAFREISTVSSPRVRYEVLTFVVNFIGTARKKSSAVTLLETARSMIGTSSRAESQAQFTALLGVSKAFAKYDSQRAFEILDPLIDQLNELTRAARTMNGFGQEYYQNDELILQNGNNVANTADALLNAIAELSKYDFGRAKGSADRIELIEVRVTAYLAIARRAFAEDSNGLRVLSNSRAF